MWQFGRLVRTTAEPNFEKHTRQTEELKKATQQLRQLRLQWEEKDKEEYQGKSAEIGQGRQNGEHTW